MDVIKNNDSQVSMKMQRHYGLLYVIQAIFVVFAILLGVELEVYLVQGSIVAVLFGGLSILVVVGLALASLAHLIFLSFVLSKEKYLDIRNKIAYMVSIFLLVLSLLAFLYIFRVL